MITSFIIHPIIVETPVGAEDLFIKTLYLKMCRSSNFMSILCQVNHVDLIKTLTATVEMEIAWFAVGLR